MRTVQKEWISANAGRFRRLLSQLKTGHATPNQRFGCGLCVFFMLVWEVVEIVVGGRKGILLNPGLFFGFASYSITAIIYLVFRPIASLLTAWGMFACASVANALKTWPLAVIWIAAVCVNAPHQWLVLFEVIICCVYMFRLVAGLRFASKQSDDV